MSEPVPSPLMTRDEAAAYLRISVNSFERHVAGGLIGPLSKLVLDKWLAANVVPPIRLRTVSPPSFGGVYFVQGGEDGPIKIGVSHGIAVRVSVLRCASPVELRVVGFVRDATRELEQLLHQMLATRRLHGEWFENCVETRTVIVRAECGAYT